MQYWYLFANSFYLKYYDDDPRNEPFLGDRKTNGRYLFGTRISSGENDTGRNKYVVNAERYFGMRREKLAEFSLPSIQKQIKKRQIVALSTSTYWCDWLPGYQKEDISHMVLVESVNNDHLVCIDSMQAVKPVCMKIDDFYKGVTQADTFHFFACKQCVAEILADSIHSIQIDQMHNDLFKLIDDLKNSENFADEFELCENGFWSCDLFRNTSYYIAGSRSLYAIFLEKVGAEIGQDELCTVANSFFGISKQWAAFKKLFMMNYYTNQIDKCQTDLIARLENIVQDELSAYDSLKKCI